MKNDDICIKAIHFKIRKLKSAFIHGNFIPDFILKVYHNFMPLTMPLAVLYAEIHVLLKKQASDVFRGKDQNSNRQLRNIHLRDLRSQQSFSAWIFIDDHNNVLKVFKKPMTIVINSLVTGQLLPASIIKY